MWGKHDQESAAVGARRATGAATGRGRGGRFSAGRKRETVLRLLRGEDLESVSRALGITAARASRWRDQFLAAGQAGLKSRAPDARDDDHRRLQAKIGGSPAAWRAELLYAVRWTNCAARRPLCMLRIVNVRLTRIAKYGAVEYRSSRTAVGRTALNSALHLPRVVQSPTSDSSVTTESSVHSGHATKSRALSRSSPRAKGFCTAPDRRCYCIGHRVLGQWFDGIRFYARRVHGRRGTRQSLGEAAVVVPLQHPVLVVCPLDLEQGQAGAAVNACRSTAPTTDSPSPCG